MTAPPRIALRAVTCAAFCSAFCAVFPAQAQPDSLPPVVAEALRINRIPQDAVSLLVLPMEGNGRARLDHLGGMPRQSASVMKLFTTGVALTTLGPAFSWRTDVALGGPLTPDGRLLGPLYLRGSGDPSLVLENVWLMMSRWRAAGLRDIQGGIVVDRGAFDVPAHDPGAFDDSPLRPYNAGPDALLLNHQAVTLRITPDAARPDSARVSMEPALDGVRLDGQVGLRKGVPCGAWREGLSVSIGLEGAPGDASAIPFPAAAAASAAPPAVGANRWVLTVRGTYPSDCQGRDWPLLWQGDGTGDHAARLLRQVWLDLGGHLGQRPAGLADDPATRPAGATALPVAPQPIVRPGTWPASAEVWQSWGSPPLLKVVQDINKFSNNVMARQLFLGLAPPPAPATLDKARETVAAQVRAATRDASGLSPCDGEALVLDNGSGLSRQAQSSAWCLGRWLQAMWASAVMPEFLSSLPVAGLDGTARRLDGGASGRAHVKTGSLDGVSAIAGVVLADSGRRYAVVGIVNHPRSALARPALDALLGWAMRDGGTASP